MTNLQPIGPLAPNLARIARVVGVDAALRVSAFEGGRYLALPDAELLDADHWLVKLIGLGLKPAQKLCDALGDPDAEATSIKIERADGSTHRDDWLEPMPPILERIASLIGNEGATKIAVARGGGRLYLPLPDHLHQDNWLVRLIGQEPALRLCREIGAGLQDIPPWVNSERTSRRRPGKHPLDDHLLSGKSISQSAILAGFDRSTARRRRVYLRGKGLLN